MSDPNFVTREEYDALKEKYQAYRREVESNNKVFQATIENLNVQLNNANRTMARWREKASDLAEILNDGYEKAQELDIM